MNVWPYDCPTLWMSDLMIVRHSCMLFCYMKPYDRPTLWSSDLMIVRTYDCPVKMKNLWSDLMIVRWKCRTYDLTLWSSCWWSSCWWLSANQWTANRWWLAQSGREKNLCIPPQPHPLQGGNPFDDRTPIAQEYSCIKTCQIRRLSINWQLTIILGISWNLSPFTQWNSFSAQGVWANAARLVEELVWMKKSFYSYSCTTTLRHKVWDMQTLQRK